MAAGTPIDWGELFRRIRKSRSMMLLEKNKDKDFCLHCYRETKETPCENCGGTQRRKARELAKIAFCKTGLMRA